MWGRVINPLWGLKAPGPATKKWIFKFCTKFGFRNNLQTFWPRRLVKNELSLGLLPELRPTCITNFFTPLSHDSSSSEQQPGSTSRPCTPMDTESGSTSDTDSTTTRRTNVSTRVTSLMNVKDKDNNMSI